MLKGSARIQSGRKKTGHTGREVIGRFTSCTLSNRNSYSLAWRLEVDALTARGCSWVTCGPLLSVLLGSGCLASCDGSLGKVSQTSGISGCQDVEGCWSRKG